MNIWGTFVVISCLVTPAHSSSDVIDYALKKINKLGLKLKPKALVSSFFRKADKCMEDGNVTSLPLSAGCLGSIFDLIYQMKPITLDNRRPSADEVMLMFRWSQLGKMLDSWGKIPESVFELTTNWFGSYQQCLRLPNTKYCVAGTRFPNFPVSFRKIYRLGTCFPKKCSNQDVKILLGIIEKVTDSELKFQFEICEKPHEYSKGNMIAICVVLLLLTLSLSGTFVEAFICKSNSQIHDVNTKNEGGNGKPNYDRDLDDQTANYEKAREDHGDQEDHAKRMKCATTSSKTENDSGTLLKQDETGQCDQISPLTQFFLCFSLLRNTRLMTSTKVSKDAIQCVNGLRVLTTCVITAGHMYIHVYSEDRFLFKRITSYLLYMPIGNSPAVVDIFFVLSGFLVSYLTLKWMDKKKDLKLKDLLYLYLHRYIRLTPALGMLMLVDTYIVPLLLSGPLHIYVDFIEPYEAWCVNYWWTNLLYINNFYPKQADNCVSWVWYLAVDMQLYIVSPFILALMLYVSKRSSRKVLGALKVIALLTAISCIIRAWVLNYYNLPSVALFSPSPKQRAEKDYEGYWDRFYVKPYTRSSPYIIGMFVGYLISRKVTIRENKWKPVVCIIGWVLAIAAGYLAIFGPHKAYTIRQFSNVEILTYGAFYGVGTGISFGWLIYACHNNIAGFINTFLSWRGWIPLSRISYGAFLAHPMVINYFRRVQEKHIHHQHNTVFFTFTGITVVSYVLGAMFCVFVEIPVSHLEKKVFSH